MIRDRFRRFRDDEGGPTAAEYAVMLAFILIVIIAAIATLGNTTSNLWGKDAQQIGKINS